MSLLKTYSLLPFALFISACSVSSPSTPSDAVSVMPHTQKTAIEISCQDLQNPAYQQAVLDRINQVRQQSRQCG